MRKNSLKLSVTFFVPHLPREQIGRPGSAPEARGLSKPLEVELIVGRGLHSVRWKGLEDKTGRGERCERKEEEVWRIEMEERRDGKERNSRPRGRRKPRRTRKRRGPRQGGRGLTSGFQGDGRLGE